MTSRSYLQKPSGEPKPSASTSASTYSRQSPDTSAVRSREEMKELARRLNHFLTFVCGEGSWSIKAHEKLVLDAALGELDGNARALLIWQLEQSFFVERASGGRINIIRFYDPAAGLRVPGDDFANLLAKVKVKVDGRQQTAHVTFYKGLLFSIEFKKPGKFYAGKDLVADDVLIGKPSQSYTQGIDRLEHGSAE